MEKADLNDAYVKDHLPVEFTAFILVQPTFLYNTFTSTMQMFAEIPDFLFAWIEDQQMFWVASAPLTADGLVNISPKGVEGTFHISGPRKVWYEDLTGTGMPPFSVMENTSPTPHTGIETVAHIRENGRVTILFNAYKGPPRITRLYGKGSRNA